MKIVEVTGPNRSTYELALAKTAGEWDTWLAVGYDSTTVVALWKDLIDTFATAFPHKYLCLDLARILLEPLDGWIEEEEEIVAYGVSRYADRFIVQYAGYGEGQNLAVAYQESIVKRYADSLPIVGFQQIVPYTAPFAGLLFASDLNAFDTTIDLGIGKGSGYFEIYIADLVDEDSGVWPHAERAHTLCRQVYIRPASGLAWILPASETQMAIVAPVAEDDSFALVVLPTGETAAGALLAAAVAGAGENFCIATRLLSSDTITLRIWSAHAQPSVWLGVRTDTAAIATPFPGVPATDTGREAFSATIGVDRREDDRTDFELSLMLVEIR